MALAWWMRGYTVFFERMYRRVPWMHQPPALRSILLPQTKPRILVDHPMRSSPLPNKYPLGLLSCRPPIPATR